jgi:hypothetical protein
LLDAVSNSTRVLLDPLENLRRLRTFQGAPEQFWSLYLDTLQGLAGAVAGILCIAPPEGEWRTLAFQPKDGSLAGHVAVFLEVIEETSRRCEAEGWVVLARPDRLLVACSIQVDSSSTRGVYLASLPHRDAAKAADAGRALLSVNDLYAQFRVRGTVAETVALRSTLADVLELHQKVQEQERFLSAAMVACNELATRWQADRTSMGWTRSGYVRLVAMSHADAFEKKMDIVRELEDAMEEALDQDADMAWPDPSGALATRAHARYGATSDAVHIASVVVRDRETPVGTFLLERASRPFDDRDLRSIRLCVDQISRTLAERRRSDRWFGARWLESLRRLAAKALGPENSLAKAGILLGIAAALFAAFAPLPYRVTGTVILRARDVVHVTAPFQGFLDTSMVRPGDVVARNQILLRLDTRDLLLREAELEAQSRSHEREFQKAQAEADLAAMQIQSALYDQAVAQLATIRRRIEQAVVRSPFDRAVIVEGDLSRRRGAPVELGSELLVVARIEDLHAEIEIPEAEVGNLDGSRLGEISLKSRPSENHAVRIATLHPAAQVRDQENVFLARAELSGTHPDWFRPGMTGLAKLEAGRRTAWWIASHSAIDFLRMKLWW